MSENIGNVIQIAGPAVDVQFTAAAMPPIYQALRVVSDGFTVPSPINVILEVQQHLGEGRVRCTRKAGADPCCILVQEKYGKDIAENHSDQDQADAAQDQETTGAERSKCFALVKFDDWLASCRIM